MFDLMGDGASKSEKVWGQKGLKRTKVGEGGESRAVRGGWAGTGRAETSWRRGMGLEGCRGFSSRGKGSLGRGKIICKGPSPSRA